MWLVCDKQGYYVLFSYCKPIRNIEKGIWESDDNKCCEVPKNIGIIISWDNEPIEVTLSEKCNIEIIEHVNVKKPTILNNIKNWLNF